jgi:hypothetical protein
MQSSSGLKLNNVYSTTEEITGLSGLTKNVVIQLNWETPYEWICYKERLEPQQKNIKKLEEIWNKYVGERTVWRNSVTWLGRKVWKKWK